MMKAAAWVFSFLVILQTGRRGIMRSLFVLAVVFLSSASLQLAAAEEADYPACERQADFRVIDSSIPVHELKFRDRRDPRTILVLKDEFNVQTIIRYYDKHTESIPCKTLLLEETDAILNHGMSIAVVFQHRNDDPLTFISETRGAEDARRALVLAAANGQPFGTTIYFGVDGADEAVKSAVWEYWKSRGLPLTEARKTHLREVSRLSEAQLNKHIRRYTDFIAYHRSAFGKGWQEVMPDDILPHVKKYFRAVRAEFQRASQNGLTYDIGGYGSGLVCKALLDINDPSVKHCWLAQSNGWPGYQEFKDSNKWSLRQKKPTTCENWIWPRATRSAVDFDFNKMNPSIPDFGQWSSRRTNPVAIPRPTACPRR